ncbi:DUF5801 repeats-in-toxin domain-containing protein, partial [Roseibium aggregatum]
AALFAGVANPGSDSDLPAPVYARKDIVDGNSGYSGNGADFYAPEAQSFTLQIDADNPDSGLVTSEGEAITLFLEDGLVVGRIDDAESANNGKAVFAIHMASAFDVATGADLNELSIVQYQSVYNADSTSSDDTVDLSGKVYAVLTITDADGDAVSSDPVDIGSSILFADDGPEALSGGSDIALDEASALATPIQGQLSFTPGADGAAVSEVLLVQSDAGHVQRFDLTDGAGATGEDLLVGGNRVTQDVSEENDVITVVGVVDDGAETPTIAFTIMIDPDGEYTYEQLLAFDHPQAGEDDVIALRMNFTVTDGDGDSDSAQANIYVADDSPVAGEPGTETVSEDGIATESGAMLEGISLGIDWGNDSYSGRGVVFSEATPVSYSDANGSLTALTSNGAEVAYTSIDGVLVGYTGAKPSDLAADNIVLTVSLSEDGAGSYDFTLLQPLDHADPVDGAHYIDLTFTFNAVDSDGDVSADSTFTIRVDAAGEISSIDYSALTSGVFINLGEGAAKVDGQKVSGDTATDLSGTGQPVVGIDGVAGIADAYGGAGDDVLIGHDGQVNILAGNAGNDTFVLGAETVSEADETRAVMLGDGTTLDVSVTGLVGTSDTVLGGEGDDKVVLDKGSSKTGFLLDFGQATLEGIEQVEGTGKGDVIVTGSSYLSDADDGGIAIDGQGGHDIIQSGAGDDTLLGGRGNDLLSGLDGDDLLIGGSGDDELHGGAGEDDLRGGKGSDLLIGGAGDDVIDGGKGDDTIVWNAGDGSDVVDGGRSRDTDTFVVNGSGSGETFLIETVDAYDARTSLGASLAGGTEIIVSRAVNGGGYEIVAQLQNIDDIVIDGASVSPSGPGIGVTVSGDFSSTDLDAATITIVGTTGDDVINVSDFTGSNAGGEQHILFVSNGGNDRIEGARASDVFDITGRIVSGVEVSGSGERMVSFEDGSTVVFTGETPVFVTDAGTQNETVVNLPPIAYGDAVSGEEDQVGGILGNVLADNGEGADLDLDGGSLSVVAETKATANGVVQIFENGDFIYTPAADFNGTDSFEYTLEDGQGGSNTAGVTVTVQSVNDPAEVSGETSGSVAEDGVTVVTGDLDHSDSDNADDVWQTVDQPAASDNGYGTFTVTAGGQWTYTLDKNHEALLDLDAGETLADTFTVYTEDGTSSLVSVTINGANELAYAVTYEIGTSAGTTLGTAFDLTGLNFVTSQDPDIGDSQQNPSVTISAQGTEGEWDYYRIDISEDGTELILDVDYGFSASQYYDAWMNLLDAAGNTIASNDDALTDSGGEGSAFPLDSYLSATLDAGTYYVQLGGFPDRPFESDYTYELQVSVVAPGDPIALDLNGDGVDLSASVAFDIDADGDLEEIGWAGPEDGLLVMDLDGSGAIENGTEVFSEIFNGGSFETSLEALASLDDNGDSTIDARDDAFEGIQVWRDANSDGAVQDGELIGLSELGIESIDLEAAAVSQPVDGNTVFAEGTFTRADGSNGTYVGFSFGAANEDGRESEETTRQSTAIAAGAALVLYTASAEEVAAGLAKVAVTGAPAHGEITVTDDFTVTFAADEGYEGPDTTQLELVFEDGSVVTRSLELDVLGADEVYATPTSEAQQADATATESQSNPVADAENGAVPQATPKITASVIAGDDGDNILVGTDGDDILAGGLGSDILTGGEGADTFVLSSLAEADVITDYTFEDGDKLDLGLLLDGAFGPGDDIDDFVRAQLDANGDIRIEVDLDGAGTDHGWQDAAVLQDHVSMGETIQIVLDTHGTEAGVDVTGA